MARPSTAIHLAPASRRADPGRTYIAAVALAGLLAGTLAIVAAAAARPSFLVPLSGRSFPGWLAGPLGFGPRLDPTGFRLIVVAMCICYAAALWLADSVSPRTAIATIAVAHVILLLGPPLLSPDVSSYLAYARLGELYGLDPYTHAPHALPLHDALQPWLVREAGPTNYGPPFTLLTYPLAHLSVAGAIWVLKVVAALASLIIVWLVARCARLRRLDPARAALLVGLNPIALLYGVGGDHNDLWMMLLLMTGVWLALRRQTGQGATTGTLAVSLKVSAAPALLFTLLGPPRRWRAIATAAITAAVLAVLVLVLFGHSDVFVNFARQVYHAEHAFARRYSVPALIGQLLGVGGVHGVTAGVRLVAGAAFAASIVALLVWLRRGGDWLAAAGWAQLAALVTTTWLWPWYMVWLLPLAALARSRLLSAAALGFTVFLLITQVFLPLG